MTFIHAYLLGGLALAGVPILLHLILRQKPKKLAFPAFRFLKQRRRINQRKMQLQHLLLLLLRVLVLVALCLALARPRLFAYRSSSSNDRSVVAALLFDTSASMEYAVGGVTRLDDAKSRAKELLAELKPESRAAVIDAGEDTQGTLLPPGEARNKIDQIRIRPGTGSLNAAAEKALRFLDKQDAGEEAPPRILYVFTDRARASWDANGHRPNVPPGVAVYVVDVGAESPRDLGIDRVEVVPPVVAPKELYQVRVSVRGTAGGHENELSCVIDGEERAPDRRPVRLEKGQASEIIVFDREAPSPPKDATSDVPFQITARLGSRDAMPFNNARHATFLVRAGHRLLTLVERRDDQRTRVWEAAHASKRSFASEVMTLDEASKLDAKQFAGYSVITLFEVSDLSEAWWKRLAGHVRAGGGLAVVPGGEELPPAFNKQGTDAGVLPATLDKLLAVPDDKPVYWAPFSAAHPLTAPFVAWIRGGDPDFARENLKPYVRRYWQVSPVKGSIPIASYADAKGNPSLVERPLGKGRTVLFTTPLDLRYTDDKQRVQWNNYWTDSSFGLVLIDRVCRYLGGEISVPVVNFTSGQVPRLSLAVPPTPPLTLSGPGLSGAERAVKPPGEDGGVALPQAVSAGNYQLTDAGPTRAGFSLDVAARESDLERVPVEELEEVLGTGTVLQVGRAVSVKDVLIVAQQPPVELLPYLMMLLLVVLTFEGLLANRFYRREPESGGAS